MFVIIGQEADLVASVCPFVCVKRLIVLYQLYHGYNDSKSLYNHAKIALELYDIHFLESWKYVFVTKWPKLCAMSQGEKNQLTYYSWQRYEVTNCLSKTVIDQTKSPQYHGLKSLGMMFQISHIHFTTQEKNC